ncbi:MAG: KH domain-containing protein [Acidimicrobiales bacterium]
MAPDEEYEAGDVNTVDGFDEGDDAVEYEDGDVNTVAEGDLDDEAEEEAGAGNRAADDLATGVLTYIARSLVEEPDAVVVNTSERHGSVRLQLHVGPEDMGRVIGRRGRTAQAIRTLVGVAGAREGVQTSVDIVDD